MRTAVPLAFLALMYAAAPLAAQAPDNRPVVMAAIERGNDEYIAAFARADAQAFARVYDPDGARFSPNGAMVRGRDAIAADFTDFVKRVGPVTVTIKTDDLWVVDNTAYETGRWTYTYTPPGVPTRTIGGRYVTVWKKQPDGGWRISADMGVPEPKTAED